MNILFYCPSKFNLKSKNNNSLGGIETLNLELSNILSSNKYKIFLSTICKKVLRKKNLINLPISTLKKNNNYDFNYIISSNDPSIFNYYKNSKNILWMHNTLAIEKAIRKKKIIACRNCNNTLRVLFFIIMYVVLENGRHDRKYLKDMNN